jgi:hypothetical protein
MTHFNFVVPTKKAIKSERNLCQTWRSKKNKFHLTRYYCVALEQLQKFCKTGPNFYFLIKKEKPSSNSLAKKKRAL